jgi:hypothetical protein
MSQSVLIEALAQEIYEAIDRYGDSIPLASAIGVLDCVKFQIMLNAKEESEKGND